MNKNKYASLAVAVSFSASVLADVPSYYEVGGDNQDIALTNLPADVTAVKKIGTGTMTEDRVLEGLSLLTAQGKSVISGISTDGFLHYRIKFDRPNNPGVSAMEISEFKLYDGDVDVTGLCSQFVFDGKEGPSGEGNTYPVGQGPDKAVDGDLTTVYYDRRMKKDSGAWTDAHREKVWLQFSFDQRQRITSYDWARGSGDEGFNRDPADWRFQGSDDGVHWFDLDVRRNFVTSKAKQTFVGPFGYSYEGCGRYLASVAVRPGAEVEVRGTELAVDDLSGGGTITCKDGGELRLTSGVTEQRGVEINGKLRVLAGTWRVCGDAVTSPYYRFTFKKVYTEGNKFQLSEIALFDRDGERTGYGAYAVKTGISVSDLQPGEILCQTGDVFGGNGAEGPDKMFDGNLESGKCFYSKRNTTEDAYLDKDDPDSWFVFTVRLREGANPVCGYNFLSAGDNILKRSPVVWIVETSDDGVSWTKLDEANPYGKTPPNTAYTFWNNGVAWEFSNIPAPDKSLVAADVQVVSNATLEVEGVAATISRLSVDLSVGGGMITTFVPAAEGVLYLTGRRLPREDAILTVGRIASAENLSTWKVYFNGVETSRRLEYRDGKLYLARTGLLILFR